MSGRVRPALWKFFRNLDRHDIARAASAMAFDAFLSMIPLLAMSGYLLSRLHHKGSSVLAPLFRVAPGPVAALADTEFLRLSDEGVAALAPLSFIAFVWVSSAGLSTAMGVCEMIFAAAERPWYRRRAIAIAIVLVTLVAFPLATMSTLGLLKLLGDAAGAVAAVIVPTGVMLGAIVAFYRIAIRRAAGVKRRVLPGALVTLALWAMVSVLFSMYVRTLARYTTLYGSLAAVAMLLLWLWLLSMALLVGGEVNAELEGVRNRDIDVPSAWRPSEGGEMPASQRRPSTASTE